MYTIWVFALSLAVALADIGLGYHYKVPETSYGVPSYQIGGNTYNTGFPSASSSNTASTGNSNTGYSGSINSAYTTTAGVGTGLNYNTQGSSAGSGYNYNTQGTGSGFNYNAGSANQGYYQGSVGQNTQSGYYQSGATSTGGSQTGQVAGSGVYNQYHTSNEYQSSSVNKYQDYYNQVVNQPPQVFKHFYVHAAPEEPETAAPRQPLILPPPQKHYKIIFIKTPAQQSPAPQLIPVPQQNEEKTIVYVLVKKPEDAQNIVLPKFEQKPPAKPEVYFIKYNNKQDSQAVINNIVNDYNQGGASSTFSGTGTGYSAGAIDSGSSASGTIGGASSTFSGTGSGYSAGAVDSGSSASGVISGISSGEYGSTTAVGGGSISDGSYSSLSASSENAYGATSEGENQSATFGTQYTSSGPTVVTTDDFGANSFSNGLKSIFGTPGTGVTSSTASSIASPGYEASAISTSQGVPHESYGLPKFKAN